MKQYLQSDNWKKSITSNNSPHHIKIGIWTLTAVICVLNVFPVMAQDEDAPSLEDLVAVLTDNDWRIKHKRAGLMSIGDSPVAEDIACSDGSEICPDEQGTYIRDPYYRVRVDADGKLHMYSDGSLNAWLEPLKDQSGNLTQSFTVHFANNETATLDLKGAECIALKEDGACFQVSGAPDGVDLTDNTYLVSTYQATSKKGMGGTMFQDQPPGITSAQDCFDVRKMDFNNPSIKLGDDCSRSIFAPLVKDDVNYEFKTFDDGKSYLMPFGWRYVSVAQGKVLLYSEAVESENQLIKSQSKSIGWKTGLNLVVLDFSVMHNKKIQERSDRMYHSKQVHTMQNYVQAQYALILDKWNIKLNEEFVTDVKIKIAALGTMNDDDIWDEFLEDWGTHYSYATTVGERGYVIDTFSESQVVALREAGLTTSSGVSAGVTVPLEEFGIPGSIGMSAGGDSGNATDVASTIKKILGSNTSEVGCTGGSTCTGKAASGSGPYKAIHLDLRPLSDLLAPPFFKGVKELPALRESLASAITDMAFTRERANNAPASEFLWISSPPAKKCRATNGTSYPAEQCTLSNTIIKLDGVEKKWDGVSTFVSPFPSDGVIDMQIGLSLASKSVTGQWKQSFNTDSKVGRRALIALPAEICFQLTGPSPGNGNIMVETEMSQIIQKFSAFEVLSPVNPASSQKINRYNCQG